MMDQYAYTRANKDKRTQYGGSYGFHLIACSEGINQPQTKSVLEKVCGYSVEDNVRDAEGRRLRVVVKRKLPMRSELTALQQSVMLPKRPAEWANTEVPLELERAHSSDNREQPVTHGYIFHEGEDDALLIRPDQWFYLDYIDYNPNVVQVECPQVAALSARPTPLWPLREMLERAQLSLDQFITAVRGSFDAQNYKCMVLVELDYSRPDAEEIAHQLLRWMFRLLPYAMRRQAAFTTCYSAGCGGGDYTILIVPSVSVTVIRGNNYGLRSGQLGYGYLIARDTVTHASSPKYPDFDTHGTVYALWLEQVIRLLYAQEGQEMAVTLGLLEEAYAHFDALVAGAPRERQCETAYYDAACWDYLYGTGYAGSKIDTHMPIPPCDRKQAAGHASVLSQIAGVDLLRPMVPYLLTCAEEAAQAECTEQWVRTLMRIYTADLSPQENETVREILTVYLAWDLDRAQPERAAKTCADFEQLIRDCGGGDALVRQLREVCFFPERYLSEDICARTGLSRLDEDAKPRLTNWLKSGCAGARTADQLLELADNAFSFFLELGQEAVNTAGSCFAKANQEAAAACTAGTNVQDLVRIAGKTDEMMERFFPANGDMEGFVALMLGNIYQSCLNRLEAEPLDLIAEIQGTVQACEEGRNPAAREYIQCLLQEQMKALSRRGNGVLADRRSLILDIIELNQAMEAFQLTGLYQEFLLEVLDWVFRGNFYTSYDEHWCYDILMKHPAALNNGTELGQKLTQTLGLINDALCCGTLSVDAFRGYKSRLDRWTSVKPLALKVLGILFTKGLLQAVTPDFLGYLLNDFRSRGEEPARDALEAQVVLAAASYCPAGEFLTLMNLFGTAPLEEAEPESGGKRGLKARKSSNRDIESREPSFVHLQTDTWVLDALAGVAEDEALCQKLLAQDPMFCPKFVNELWEMAPEGTQGAPRAREIATKVWSVWNTFGSPSPDAVKEMKQLRKRGAFEYSKG